MEEAMIRYSVKLENLGTTKFCWHMLLQQLHLHTSIAEVLYSRLSVQMLKPSHTSSLGRNPEASFAARLADGSAWISQHPNRSQASKGSPSHNKATRHQIAAPCFEDRETQRHQLLHRCQSRCSEENMFNMSTLLVQILRSCQVKISQNNHTQCFQIGWFLWHDQTGYPYGTLDEPSRLRGQGSPSQLPYMHLSGQPSDPPPTVWVWSIR